MREIQGDLRSLLLVLLTFLPVPLTASINAGFAGSLKSLASYQRLRQSGIYSQNDQWEWEQRLRLSSNLTGPWFRGEAAVESNLVWHQVVTTAVPLPDTTPQYAWNREWNYLEGEETNGRTRLDRLFLKLHSETWANEWELVVGRQTIPMGVGQIFSAVSQTQRYPYVTIDAEYEKTEDAVTVVWLGVLRLEARWLPKTPSQQEQNFHLRAKGSKSGFDVALTTGRTDDKEMIGLELAGNVGDSVLRGEVAAYDAKERGYVQALVGWDRAHSAKWNTKFELFFNGFGEPRPYSLTAFRHRSAPYRGRLYAGTAIGWDPTPLLKVYLHAISNLTDVSFLFHPHLQYSLRSNLDLILGQYLGVGPVDGEFGGQVTSPIGISLGLPDLTYLGIRLYF